MSSNPSEVPTVGFRSLSPGGLGELVEEVDNLLWRAFQDTDLDLVATDARDRYELLLLLLRGAGEYCIGFDVAKIRQKVGRYTQQSRNLDAYADRIAELLAQVVSPTYVVINYWSPIDRRRHTVTYRPPLSTHERERTVLAHYYAFFALTLSGPPNYYSLMHYIAEAARWKRGLGACYAETLPNRCPGRWWHLPKSAHQPLLQALGLYGMIESRLLSDGISTDKLLSALQRALVNAEDSGWDDINEFSRDAIALFAQARPALSPSLTAMIERTRDSLSAFFEASFSFEQALFLAATHILVARVCPTTYVNAFAVPVADTCCVLTVGTTDPPDPDSAPYLALGQIARSVFTHPLLLDYGAQEAAARERYAAGAIHKLRGPLSYLRDGLGYDLRAAFEAEKKGSKELCVRVLDGPFKKKYETSLARIESAIRSLSALIGGTKPEVFDAVPLLQRAIADVTFYPDVKIQLRNETEVALVKGWRGEFEFSIEELLYNSVRALRKSGRKSPAITIEIRHRSPNAVDDTIEIIVADNGPGIPAEFKDKVFLSGFRGPDSGSTGKGLYLVRYFVERRFNGRICETGEAGRGAKFVITIPSARVEP